MSNAEETSGGNPMNLDDHLRAMQQQFARMNVVFGEIRDRMDRQDERITNLQRVQPNHRRHNRQCGASMDESESENDEVSGASEEDFESEYEVGRHRNRGDRRYKRRHGRNIPRERNRVDGDLGSIKMKIPPFQGRSDPEAYLEWEKKIEMIFECCDDVVSFKFSF